MQASRGRIVRDGKKGAALKFASGQLG